ncbi:hypothetical protein Pfo_009732 [Paulownia fortunei]|nr:hypothetical protein Pfo_009732 [Paulownia fortunei]
MTSYGKMDLWEHNLGGTAAVFHDKIKRNGSSILHEGGIGSIRENLSSYSVIYVRSSGFLVLDEYLWIQEHEKRRGTPFAAFYGFGFVIGF